MVTQLGFKRGVLFLGALIGSVGVFVTAGAYLLIPSYFSQHDIGLIGGGVLSISGLAVALTSSTRQPVRFVPSIASAVAAADVAVLAWAGVFLQLWIQGVGRFA